MNRMNSLRPFSEAKVGGYTTKPYSMTMYARQPPRILVIDVGPPFWGSTCSSLCEALENFLSLACSLDGPCRIPLLSLYVVHNQHECLLPFVQIKGNFPRLQSCVSELRSLPKEGSFQPKVERMKPAVLDGLQQFKQYSLHMMAGGPHSSCSVEITIMTSQSGKEIVKELEAGLKDTDLMGLRRLQVIHLFKGDLLESVDVEWISCSGEEDSPKESSLPGTDIEFQTIENDVISIETFFKAWLHDNGIDKEHLHLLFPSGCLSVTSSNSPMCVKCDVQERLLDPTLLPSTVSERAGKAASGRDVNTSYKMTPGQMASPCKLGIMKAVKSNGVCESVLFGLPLIIKPTICWQLDWDELETNQQNFHALCHCLLKRDWVLLAKSEPQSVGPSWSICVHTYYIIMPSASFTLLAKPVAVRELLLPCDIPATPEEPPEMSLQKIESVLNSLEVESTYNPLNVRSNLFKHLRGLLSRAPGNRNSPAQFREQRTQPRQQGRQIQSKAKATVAPLPMVHTPARPAKSFRTPAPAKNAYNLSLFSDEEEFLRGIY
ncbi:LOW QUALITY PROTEIN: meiosis 1 arrest protein [Microcaecilia unicolor]|uniref:LOW QUALITY PROTEIN: meiosis 1 arrest protein n=1 Tax=Microcaecilia unicolor TaxID=1415580 RepID=A0A6P7XCQ9_9AMPH|nr:LOW QUALITY PROTEIN: meiosis 1 arrest protein [Microcaecilia unicolor]